MAYMCVLAHSRECDGCMECEEISHDYDGFDETEADADREDAYFGREE